MVTPGLPPIPHVGGPVLPAGCPTVLIGGMPAARMGDTLLCVGPPDVIAGGDPTVMIGGQMAARMGDVTAHGGSITVGLPTVLIGFPTGAGGKVDPNAVTTEQYGPGIRITGTAAFRAKMRAELNKINSTPAGHAVLSRIDASGHTTTISEYAGNNSFSGPTDFQAATAKGQPVFDGSGKPMNDASGHQLIGTGTGSDTTVQLNPNLTLPNSNPGAAPMPNDAVLFHELNHSSHQTNGNMDCTPTPGYDTAEEKRTITSGDPSEADYLQQTGYPYHRTDHGTTFAPNSTSPTPTPTTP
jgi:uncharacterized Zn-binding protein involved in type VI secretion